MVITILGYEVQQWIIAYLVLILPLVISWYWGLGLHKDLLGSGLRALLQLFVMALILIPVLQGPWWSQVLLVLFMIAVGAFIARERGRDIPGVFWVSFLAILVAYGSIMVFFVLLGGLRLEAIIIVPISGMFIGMATRTLGQVYHKIKKDFEEYRESMEAMLIDGADWTMALAMAKRDTIQNAMVPAIDSLKTLGIVHIPGAMAGMMLAGQDPLVAAGYQILIMFGMVANGAVASLLGNQVVYRILFEKAYPHLKATTAEISADNNK